MHARTPISLILAIVGVTVLSGSDGCSTDLLEDPGFDLWCGEQLCSWEVERGKVGKAATWDQMDEGAALAGPRAAISQYAPIDERDASCIRFSLLADTDPDATLVLELDFMDDGSVEYAHEIPSQGWEQVAFHVTPPHRYHGVRFRIVKEGWDRAVIAQLRVQTADQQSCAVDAIELEPIGDLAPPPPDDTGI